MIGHVIKCVEKGSIAEELEIESGDILLQINSQEIRDIFDYQYLTEDEELTLLIEKAGSHEQQLCEVEKDEDEDLGIVFENGLMDDYKSCHNKCVFCFIDQNPPGMRETIYFKDDDSRLSFLQGNYVTLTNMSDADIERIISYNLSPINISIHTMNPSLRCEMLHNRFAGDSLKKIDRLCEAGVPMNGQIVLCKGINDGKELEFTLNELLKYAPVMESVSVVPVGLTKYRDGLCELKPFEKEDAIDVIDLIEKVQSEAMERFGMHFIHASDEWYILAGRDFPDEDSYDGYLQLENGVGMTRLLIEEFSECLSEKLHKKRKKNRRAVLVTGELIYPVIKQLSEALEEKYPDVSVSVIKIENRFFGERITVTGLLTGGDIVSQLSGTEFYDELLLPGVTLRRDDDVFLDDMTIDEFREKVGIPVRIVGASGREMFDAMLGL